MNCLKSLGYTLPVLLLMWLAVPAIWAYEFASSDHQSLEQTSLQHPPAPPVNPEIDPETQQLIFKHHEKLRLREAAFKAIDHMVKMDISDRDKIETLEALLKDAKDPAIHNKISVILASYYVQDVTKRKEALELYKGIVTTNDNAIRQLD